jgi:hypothetical protein
VSVAATLFRNAAYCALVTSVDPMLYEYATEPKPVVGSAALPGLPMRTVGMAILPRAAEAPRTLTAANAATTQQDFMNMSLSSGFLPGKKKRAATAAP